ncbi:MAG: hypothetical protein PF445_12500 [Melioribacteraceae bacterium]|jgi:hypothetical protein|nr:hypothetical protein [Melioribacteraceae bacterium]
MTKLKIVIITLILLIFGTNFSLAQVTVDEAKKATESFFTLCKKNDFKNSAKILAYSGADKSRLYKDIYNANNPDEFKEVKRICKKVNATLLISDSYSFGKFRDRTIDGKKLQSLDVQFLSGSQKIRRKILFIKIKGVATIFDYN